MKYIIAIDPGTKESGVCILQADDYKPVFYKKLNNNDVFFEVKTFIRNTFMSGTNTYEFAIEMVASYGMPVGMEVFETCVWIGRFVQHFGELGFKLARIYRQEEKLTICHSQKANDATIKQALVDRFAPGESNYGKGTKKAPGWFYGFSRDVWQAYAVGVTYIDKERKNEQ